MPVFISLLRGINVGGNKIVKMDALQQVYSSLGFARVQTHLQSGNVLFQSELTDRARLAKKIEDAIEETFGFQSDIVLRNSAQLREVIARSPWSTEQLADPGRLLVLFLSGVPDSAALRDFLKAHAGPEEIAAKGQELYLSFPTGMGQSKLNTVQLLKKLKTSGTGRNWNTVTKLLELAQRMDAL